MNLIPDIHNETYVVDICCGEGHLCEYLLDKLPNIKIIALDGDVMMLARTTARLARFEKRFEVRQISVLQRDWYRFNVPVSAFISSLAIHRLNDGQKQQLFNALYEQLQPKGALLIADMVKPETAKGKKIAAIQWDGTVRERSLLLKANLEPFLAFEKLGWNSYFDPNFDSNFESNVVDKPSTLRNQLDWLGLAGFVNIDVYWMIAGQAIFGGYKF